MNSEDQMHKVGEDAVRRVAAAMDLEVITDRNRAWINRVLESVRQEATKAFLAGRDSAFDQINDHIHGTAEQRAMRGLKHATREGLEKIMFGEG